MGKGNTPEDVATVTAASVRWRFGDVLLDEATLELQVKGQRVELRRKPLELLMFFVRNPGEVVTKDELFEAVWPGRIVSETSLTNAIGLLRAALGDEEQAIIKAVYGYGYRFMAAVVREESGPEPAPPASFDFQPQMPVPHRAEWTLESGLGGGSSGEVWLAQHKATREKRVFKFARDAASLGSLKREITLFRLMRESLPAHASLGWNGVKMNGLIINGFVLNGLTINGLTINGLTINGIFPNGLTINGTETNGIAPKQIIAVVLRDGGSYDVR